MSEIERLAGEVIVVGLPRERLAPETEALLRGLRPGGIVLFDRNVSTLEATRALVVAARAAIGGEAPALVCVDQEGGRVARLRFRDPGIPSMLGLGAASESALAERAGAALADDLLAIGANVDFAPVLDLALAPQSTVIGRRSFGDDPQRVAELGTAFVRGMQARGVAATAKHFPGHGATALDSHRELPVVEATTETLRARDLVPFAAAIEAGVDGVMAAHVRVPALDAHRPASLSRAVLSDLLRDELRYDGVAWTDCLQMDAIALGAGTVAGGVLALAAGADALLISHDIDLALALRDAVVAGVRDGAVPFERLAEAARRVGTLRAKRAAAATARAAAVDDVAIEIATRAIALVRGHGTIARDRPVTVVSFEGDASDGIAHVRSERPSLSLALRRLRMRSELMRVPLDPDDETIGLLVDVLRAQGDRTIVIVARRAHLYPAQVRAIDAILAVATHSVGISALEPFDVFALARADAVLCSFGDDDANAIALANVLVGDARATGAFPIALSSDADGSRRMRSEAEIDALLPHRAVVAPGDALGDDAEAGGA